MRRVTRILPLFGGFSASLFLLLTASPAVALDPCPGATFIANHGQVDSAVLYYANGPTGAVFLTRDAIVLDECESAGRQAGLWKSEPPDARAPEQRRTGRASWIRFDNGGQAARVEGQLPSPARLSFFFGADPDRWLRDVPSFGEVLYRQVWPGIDLVISLREGVVTCRAEAAPDADLSRIAFSREGSEPGDVAGIDLLLPDERADAGATPREQEGSATRDDPSRLLWSTYLGGSSEEIAWSVALDSAGNPVVTGVNFSTFFPTTPGAYDQSYAGFGDVFVSKFSSDGSTLLWSTFLGGTSQQFDYGYEVRLDSANNPIVTGYTFSADYPVTPGAFSTIQAGGADVFVSKLSADGRALLWSTFVGGGEHDLGYSLDLDAQENVVVSGRTLSADFPVVPGSYDVFPNGEEDAFVLKLNAQGSALLWNTFVGGSLYDGASSVKLDPSGAPIIAGFTASADYPGGAYAGGLYDVVATKLKADGTALLWSRTLGGESYEYGNALALDASGDPVLCGATDSPDFPVTAGAYDPTYNTNDDVFVVKLRNSDGGVIWGTYLGGSTPIYETAFGLEIDSFDCPVLTGTTPSGDFPVTADAYDTQHNGALDVFVARLGESGSTLEWSTFLGGESDDYGWSLALDGPNDVVVCGDAGSGLFPTTPGAYDRGYNGDISDVFVAKLRGRVDITETEGASLPDAARLGLALRPNPSRGEGWVTYRLPAPSEVRIDLYDALGRHRSSIFRGFQDPGEHAVAFRGAETGRRLTAGRYYLRISSASGDGIEPVTVVR